MIVNTHGWVKGLGVPVLHELARLLSPAITVQITTAIEGRNISLDVPDDGAARIHSGTQLIERRRLLLCGTLARLAAASVPV